MGRVELYYFQGATPPSGDDVTSAFWGACHGGQITAAQYLQRRGADINWLGWDELTALDAARRSDASEVVRVAPRSRRRSALKGLEEPLVPYAAA
jgi:hypothetical protein